MGIFDFFRKKSAEPVKSENENDRVDTRPVMSFDGDVSNTVYVYDATVLPTVRLGDTFCADVLPYDVTLVSRHTGTTVSTDGMSAALEYNGKVFGSTITGLECLKEVAAMGYRVPVKIKKTGMYSSEIPQLESLTQDQRELRWWWKICRLFDEIIPFEEADDRVMEIAFHDSEHGIHEGSVTVSLELIPWKSSRAKNPMTISMKVDGIEILQAKAKTLAREKLAPFAGKTSRKAVISRYANSGKWKITALFD